MRIFKSKETAYDPHTKKNVPFWTLDTAACCVKHFNEGTHETESTSFHTDCIQYHLSYSASKHPEGLQRLVDDGNVIEYLDDLEKHVIEAIDSQVERWKKSDKEYLIAVDKGDIQKAAGLDSCLVFMAREIIFDCMVYI